MNLICINIILAATKGTILTDLNDFYKWIIGGLVFVAWYYFQKDRKAMADAINKLTVIYESIQKDNEQNKKDIALLQQEHSLCEYCPKSKN